MPNIYGSSFEKPANKNQGAAVHRPVAGRPAVGRVPDVQRRPRPDEELQEGRRRCRAGGVDDGRLAREVGDFQRRAARHDQSLGAANLAAERGVAHGRQPRDVANVHVAADGRQVLHRALSAVPGGWDGFI